MKIQRVPVKRLREEILKCTYPNGLVAYVVRKPGVVKKIGIFGVRYGALDMTFKQNGSVRDTPAGVAHFLEHQLFKKHGGDSLMEFSRWGAESNAYTNHTSTVYHFTCSDHFERCLEELFRLVLFPEFEPQRVEREKLIIRQELLLYDDMPDVRGYRNLLQALYRNHPVRIDIGGTVESIQEVNKSILDECYSAFYTPKNLTLVMAGDLDPERTFRTVNRLLKGHRSKSAAVERVLPKEPPGVERDRISVDMVVSRPKVLVGFKDVIEKDDAVSAMKRDVATSILMDVLFGRAGEFFNKQYNAGLIDDEFSVSYTTEETYGYSIVAAETDTPDEFVKKVREAIARAKFKASDLTRIKRKLAGRFIKAFDGPENAAFAILEIEQKGISLDQIFEAIQRLTPRDLERRLEEHFQDRNMAVSLVLPRG